jgi:hypothetical protein
VSIPLPHPIDLYVKLENSGDVEAVADCFAFNATVRDEGQTYDGPAAIKEWMAATKRKYNHTVAPLELAYSGGKTLLTAELTGSFPGSPAMLEFIFVVKDRKIVSLEIK